MTASTLILDRQRIALHAVLGGSIILVLAALAFAAVTADEKFKREALINQENITWQR